MPLSKTNELNLIMNENAKLTVEHSGGDGWTLLHGDTLSIVRAFKPGVFDAVITDPPYASGGAKPSEKNRTTTQKYSSMRADKALPDFDGDQKDQRSWTRWMAEWLSDVRKACKAGAVLCVFIDWRAAQDAAPRLLRRYCHKVYELGYVPICPRLSLPQYLSEDVPEEQRAMSQISQQLLRRCRMLVVCGGEITAAMAGEIGAAEKLKLICTTLDGLAKIKEQNE